MKRARAMRGWFRSACLLVLLPCANARAQGDAAPIGVSAAAPPPASPERFGEVPDFAFTEADGRVVTRADLLGAPWLAVPFFVECTGPCPSITTDLAGRLADRLAGTPIRIVSLSIDPKLDTPAELAAYRSERGIDPELWLFLTHEDEKAVHEFVSGGLKVPVARTSDESVAYGDSITHGTRMPVVDGEGRIAGWYELAAPTMIRGIDDPARHEEVIAAHYALVEARLRALAGLPFGLARPYSPLPLVNACLNLTAFVLLLFGYAAIKRGHRERHERLMKLAFLASALFLASYLYYHGVVQREHGPTPFLGTGVARGAYFALLISHVVLAIVNLPMVLRTFWLAHAGRFEEHKRLARKTFPIWLYVSITGVIVYVVLYPLNQYLYGRG